MKYIITESQYTRIISEQTSSDLYSAVLGYLDLNGSSIIDNAKDKFKMFAAKKEVMKFCENKRDGKPVLKFKAPESTALFNTVLKLVKDSSNIKSLVDKGKNIRHVS